MALVGLVVVWVIVRMCLAVFIMLGRALSVLLFSPISRPRSRRARGRAVHVRTPQAARGVLYELLNMSQSEPRANYTRSREPRAPAAAHPPPSELSRNHQDCIRALVQLGFSKPDAARASKTAVSQLGAAATLDALVRVALQQLSRSR